MIGNFQTIFYSQVAEWVFRRSGKFDLERRAIARRTHWETALLLVVFTI